MPVFEFEQNGKTFEVDAPDASTAQAAFLGVAKQASLQSALENKAQAMRDAPDFQNNLAADRQYLAASDAGRQALDIRASNKENSMLPQWASDLPRMAIQGVTMNAADEVLAGLATPAEMIRQGTFDVSKAYSAAKDREDAKIEAMRRDNGYTGLAAETLGSAAGLGGLAKAGLTFVPKSASVGLGTRTLAGAADGAVAGAVSGYLDGTTPDERSSNAITGAAVGGVAGGIAGRIAGGVAKKAAYAKLPTSEQIANDASLLYKASDEAGVVLNSNGLGQAAKNIISDVQKDGFDEMLHPNLARVLNRLQDAGSKPLSLGEVDTLRKIASGAVNYNNPGEKRLISKVIDGIDNYIENLNPSDVIAGDKNVGVQALQKARKVWSQFRKSKMVDDLLEAANIDTAVSGSGGNINNASRRAMKKLLKDPKYSKNFTKQEMGALRQLVFGTPTQNALRLIGKLSPEGNGLMALLNVGGVAANPSLLPIPAAGFAAKRLADAGTKANAEALSAVIRNGGQMPSIPTMSNAEVIRYLGTSGGQALMPAFAASSNRK